jgi:hypothetical protein
MSSAGIFILITNEGKADEYILAQTLLKERLMVKSATSHNFAQTINEVDSILEPVDEQHQSFFEQAEVHYGLGEKKDKNVAALENTCIQELENLYIRLKGQQSLIANEHQTKLLNVTRKLFVWYTGYCYFCDEIANISELKLVESDGTAKQARLRAAAASKLGSAASIAKLTSASAELKRELTPIVQGICTEIGS